MNSLAQTYQPTAAEIASVVASAQRRHSDMSARIDRAADILANGLQLEPVAWQVGNVVRWRIASQSHGGAYIVNEQRCCCQDSRAPQVGHERRCKHSIAANLYAKVITNKFNASVRARQIDLGILPDGTFNAYYRDTLRMGHVHVKRMGSGYVFADSASMVRFSLHLAAQPVAVAVAWPTLAQVAA